MRKWLKTAGIIGAAIVLSTLGISASDTLEGVSGTLVGMVAGSQKVEGCGDDSVLLTTEGRRLCVDRFEASPVSLCPNTEPNNARESEQNLGSEDVCRNRALMLSRGASSTSARRSACAAAGKRLLTNAEWYRAALGTPGGQECNISNQNAAGPRHTEAGSCISSVGAYDMIGNVWEWTDESVASGQYRERTLPGAGYVAAVDADGVAVMTKDAGDELYGDDYAWSSPDGVRGMLRGGFYGSGTDGGLYTLNASIEPSFASAGVGFRCVRDYPI